LILLFGEPGIGKTRTAEELAAYVRHSGARALWGRCYEGEGAPAFWPWVQIVRSAVDQVGVSELRTLLSTSGVDLAQLVPEFRERMPELPSAPALEPIQARERIFDSMGRFLTRLSQEHPLVVIIDDLQGADLASALLVQFMARLLAQPTATRLLLVIACRAAALTARTPLGDVLAGLTQPNGHAHLHLGGLSQAEVTRFVEIQAGAVPALEVAAQLYQVTEGNPLFLKEVVQLIQREGHWPQNSPDLPMPATVSAVIGRRLAALSPSCRQLLAAAAVIGRDFRETVVGDVVSLDSFTAPVTKILEEGVQHQIIGPTDVSDVYRFSHALMRETLYAELSADRRQQLHRRVGEALERTPAVGELLTEIAHHFLAGDTTPDLRKAVVYAQRAAERALALVAYEDAVRLCEIALAALDRIDGNHDLSRCELLLTLAHAQKGAVDTATSRATFEQAVTLARSLRTPDLFARAVLGTRWVLDLANADADNVRLLEEALEALGPDDSLLRAKLLAALAGELLASADVETFTRSAELSREAVAVARRVGDPQGLSDALETWISCACLPENLDERLAAVNELVALGEMQRSTEIAAKASRLRLGCLFDLGDVAGAERELEHLARCAATLQLAQWLYWIPYWRATFATFRGRFADAERFAREALELGQRAKEPRAFQMFPIQIGFPLLLQGRLPTGRGDAIDQPTADMAWNWGVRTALILRAHAVGDETSARAQFEACAAHDFTDISRTNRLLALAVLSEFAAHFNDTRRAALLYPRLLPFKTRNVPDPSWGSVARFVGLTAATLGRVDEAALHFEDAIAHNSRMGARPHLALTQTDYARLLLQRDAAGDRAKAGALLHVALTTARELGMSPLIAKAQALQELHQLAAIQAPESRPSGQSPAADRLSVSSSSPSTVSTSGSRARLFVGREHEIAVLRAAVDDALAGRGRLVLLAGEPGIGKTRTAEEIAAYARERGGAVLWGRCYEGEGAPAFWPWVQVLRAGLTHFESEALRVALGADAAELALIVPALREQWPDLRQSPTSDSPEARFRLFDSVARFLGKLAQQAPLVIVIDDLHGADHSSLLLLEFVARGLRELPLLVLGTHRDVGVRSEHPLTQTLVDVARESGTERLVLHGLSASEIAEFIQASAGVEPPAALVTRLHERTEGNPLFVGEFVQVLLSDGRLDRRAKSGWNITVPSNVQTVIGRHLAPLSGACREVLRTAAVIGREFRLDVLEATVAGSRSPVASSASIGDRPLKTGDLLAEAVAAQVLEGFDGSGRGRFAHALIRETLFEELGTSRRQQLHRTVGESIERRPDAEETLAELAYHFFEGGENEKAVTYAQRAGDRALLLLAYEEAVRLYQLGVDASLRGSQDGAPADNDRHDRQRCELLLGLGEALNGAGKTALSKETVLRAADIARRLGLREYLSRAALGFGVRFAHGEAGVTEPTQVSLLEEAIQCWGTEDSAFHARLLGRLATALIYMPAADRRTALCDQAASMARRIGDRNALAFVLNAQHVAGWGPGNQAERIAIATEIAHLARQSGDRHLVFQAHFWRANDALELGNFDEFEADLDTCARLAEELRQPYHAFHVELFQAARAAILGCFEDAQRLATAAHASGMKWHETAAAQFSSAHTLNLALLTGEPLDGFVAFMEAAIAQHLEVPGLRSLLARVYAELGCEGPARREFNQIAATDFADWPRDGNLLPSLAFLSATCTFLGDTERAATLYELLKPYAERAAVITNVGAYFGCCAHYLGALAATMSRWDDAVRHFKDAIAFNTRMRARPHLTLTQHAYAQALLARGKPGDRETALSLLADAHSTARELGMKRLEEKVSRLLPVLSGVEGPLVSDPQAEAHARVTTHESRLTNTFRREGNYWTIAFDGSTFRVKDSKGLQYLAHLIRCPDREFHVLDLAAQQLAGNGNGAEFGDGEHQDFKMPLLDARAKAQYTRRVDDLREELQEAERNNDRGRSERARTEMDLIGEQLSAAVGLGGRDRAAARDAERARLAVTKRIKAALKTIRSLHPSLARHLSLTIKTGYYCTYQPPSDTPILRVV
jgi:predicted ATPase